MNDFGPKRPMSESAETAPTDTAKAKRGRPKKKPDYDRENVRKKACTRLTCSRICDILESWETVALAALIIANLYTVSSRQQSKDRLRCEEEYNGLKYMKNIDKRKLIITLCTIVAIVAVGLGIFKMLQLVKEVEQVKDYNTESLRWAIIGAIGSWTGSVFGAIALVVSLVALWLPQRVKIAVGVSTGFILSQIPGIEKNRCVYYNSEKYWDEASNGYKCISAFWKQKARRYICWYAKSRVHTSNVYASVS